MKMRFPCRAPEKIVLSAALATSFATATAMATERQAVNNDMDVKVSGSLIAGAIWTAENANPDYIFRRNAQVVGKSDLSMYNPKGGRNGDDGRLNYTGKELASTPVILNAKLEARFRNYKAVVAGKAWYDHHQLHHDVPFGSLANGYQANVPL
ncbi:DUF1302 family protein, partial [Alcanivorax sp. HI0044]